LVGFVDLLIDCVIGFSCLPGGLSLGVLDN
jgi:hypothetical protein